MEGETVAIVIASVSGLMTLGNAGLSVWRSLGQDGRDAVSKRLDALDQDVARLESLFSQLTTRTESRAAEAVSRAEFYGLAARVGTIELDEREERGQNLPGKVDALDRRMQALEGTVRSEVRSAREQISDVLDAINELRGS